MMGRLYSRKRLDDFDAPRGPKGVTRPAERDRYILSKRLGSPYRSGRSAHWGAGQEPESASGEARGGGGLGAILTAGAQGQKEKAAERNRVWQFHEWDLNSVFSFRGTILAFEFFYNDGWCSSRVAYQAPRLLHARGAFYFSI
jgi:hypothetical protein